MSDRAVELRSAMVDLLIKRGVGDRRVLDAMRHVPRHAFLPEVMLEVAYADRAIPVRWAGGLPTSSASQPTIVASMLELLEVPVGGSVLEIGTGSGYNAALLGHLVGPKGRVVSVDIQAELVSEARGHLAAAGVANVELASADGSSGWPSGAPFDRIIVTAGASDLAPVWVDQLSDQGRLVLPLSVRGVQQCVAFAKVAPRRLSSKRLCECGFMPLQGAMANADLRLPIAGHPGVFLHAAPDANIDLTGIGEALYSPGALLPTTVTAGFLEIFGSLRRWLAFHDDRAVMLAYLNQAEEAPMAAVPRLLDFPLPGAAQWSSIGLIGPHGLALLDQGAQAKGEGLDAVISLAVRPFGRAEHESARLLRHLADWDVGGRPGADRLGIEARQRDRVPAAARGEVVQAHHTAFVLSWP